MTASPFLLPTDLRPVQPLPAFLNQWTLPNPQVALCGNHDHFAIIYDDPEEQLDFIVPFLRLGLERGEKAVFIYDDNSPETVIAAMERTVSMLRPLPQAERFPSSPSATLT